VAKKYESGKIKVPEKDLRAVGKVLQKGTQEQKEQIVSEVKSDFKKAIETAKEITAPQIIEQETSEPPRPLIQLQEEPLPDPAEAVQKWQEDLAARGGSMGLQRSIFTDLLELKSIRDRASYLPCPRCGRPGMLVWRCCGSTIDEAVAHAQALADAKMGSRAIGEGEEVIT
jgi:hypothetical protein